MELLLVMALVVLIAIFWVELASLREHRQIRRHLSMIESLTRDSRSHQGSIGLHKSTDIRPVVERAKRQGVRGDIPATGRQTKALKFTRVGGEFERNRDGDRLHEG